jgi:L-2,4-diaminobutyrate decarboxylase
LGCFCMENNIWFHIDGAHGGPAVFSKKYASLMKGAHRADSTVVDFHKMMLSPALTTLVLFKNGQTSYETFAQKAEYLLSEKKEWFNSAKRTIECTKKPMSLKVFLMIKTYGSEIFEKYINLTYDLGREFAEAIEHDPKFELAIPPDSNIVCFRFADKKMKLEQQNQLNLAIRDKIMKDGSFYIVQTMIDGKAYFRITIMNPFTTIEILNELLVEIVRLVDVV